MQEIVNQRRDKDGFPGAGKSGDTEAQTRFKQARGGICEIIQHDTRVVRNRGDLGQWFIPNNVSYRYRAQIVTLQADQSMVVSSRSRGRTNSVSKPLAWEMSDHLSTSNSNTAIVAVPKWWAISFSAAGLLGFVR